MLHDSNNFFFYFFMVPCFITGEAIDLPKLSSMFNFINLAYYVIELS